MRNLDDLDELACPDEIDDVEQLREVLCTLIAQHNQLLVEARRLDKLVIDALERSREAGEDVDDLQAAFDTLQTEFDEIREDVEVVNATMPDQQQDKLNKIRGILSYAVTEATGGPAGVVVETGEATAAAKTSRNTALRLMDEIGANFSWASVETPGGPNPKQLRIATDGRDVHDLMGDVREAFDDGGAVSG